MMASKDIRFISRRSYTTQRYRTAFRAQRHAALYCYFLTVINNETASPIYSTLLPSAPLHCTALHCISLYSIPLLHLLSPSLIPPELFLCILFPTVCAFALCSLLSPPIPSGLLPPLLLLPHFPLSLFTSPDMTSFQNHSIELSLETEEKRLNVTEMHRERVRLNKGR
jgi:hypothetical protein